MFDMKMMQQMQAQLKEKMAGRESELAQVRCEGASGGGMVKVVVDGNQRCVEVKIQPDAVDPDDIEMLEDLVQAALNAAAEKSKEAERDSLAKITGGFNIPGLTM